VRRRSHCNRLVGVIQQYEGDQREWIKARLPGLDRRLAKAVADMHEHAQT